MRFWRDVLYAVSRMPAPTPVVHSPECRPVARELLDDLTAVVHMVLQPGSPVSEDELWAMMVDESHPHTRDGSLLLTEALIEAVIQLARVEGARNG
jgi:hypothetical protein